MKYKVSPLEMAIALAYVVMSGKTERNNAMFNLTDTEKLLLIRVLARASRNRRIYLNERDTRVLGHLLVTLLPGTRAAVPKRTRRKRA